MPITHTNRKGITYILCQGQTKTGKPRYTFAREPQGAPPDELPAGYEISGLKKLLSWTLSRFKPSSGVTERFGQAGEQIAWYFYDMGLGVGCRETNLCPNPLAHDRQGIRKGGHALGIPGRLADG